MKKNYHLRTGVTTFALCLCAGVASAANDLSVFSDGYEGYMEPGEVWGPAAQTYTGTADTGTQARASAYFNILPGYYIPSSSSSPTRTPTTCPANSYCPGVQGVTPDSTTAAIGITACNTGFASDAGSTSALDCSKSCTKNDLICFRYGDFMETGDVGLSESSCNSSAVATATGRVYQDPDSSDNYLGLNTCVATGCSKGYSLAPAINFTDMFDGSLENVFFMTGWNSTYQTSELAQTYSSGAVIPSYMSEAHINHETGPWAVTYTVNGTRREIDGMAYCVAYSSDDDVEDVLMPYDSRLTPVATDSTRGKYCYCAPKFYKDYSAPTEYPGTYGGHAMNGPAVFVYKFEGSVAGDSCNSSCAETCVSTLAENTNDFITKFTKYARVEVANYCTADIYTVSFNPNGGSGGPSEPETVTYGGRVSLYEGVGVTPSNPTRTGYTFGGWYDLPSSSGGIMYVDVDGLGTHDWEKTTDGTLYARWTANTYTVSFSANGGSGGQSASVTATYDSSMPAISSTAPTRAGYTFDGWYDTSDGTGGTKYYNINGSSAHIWDKTSDTTLYARWAPKKIYIMWGNVSSPYNQTQVDYDGDIQTPSPENVIQRSGQVFLGWRFSLTSGD